MKKKRLLTIVTAVCLIAGMFSFSPYPDVTAFAADTAGKYDSILEVSDENAYVLLDKTVEEHNCDFLDGRDSGITDTTHVLYNENSQQDGLNGRLFNVNNHLSVAVDKSFYEEGDSEFLVTVVYYDFGPKQGRFFFEYYDRTGAMQIVTIIKPGNVQRFNAETIYINNLDLNSQFADTGANLRIRTNGQNLFKKVEVVNLSKLKREKRSLSHLAALPSNSSLDELASLGIIDASQKASFAENMSANCTVSDASSLLSVISGKTEITLPAGYNGADNLTQGALLDMYLQALSLNRGEKSPEQYAAEIGLVSSEDLFYDSNVMASNYNLTEICYNTLYFKKADGTSLLEVLLANEFFDEKILASDESLIALSYKNPRKLPYQTITENETGQTYYYMNICNIPTIRTYVTAQSWTSDGKSFVCGFQSGKMFIYNTETQMLTYIDETLPSTQLCAVVGTDDYVYYSKVDAEGQYSLWKADLTVAPIKPEFICSSINGNSLGMVHITNDCKYISAEMYAPGNTKESITGRYSVDEGKWVTYIHPTFPYSPAKTHDIINPEYPNLVSFCHEVNGVKAFNLYDRIWQVDLDTMQAQNIFKQGIRVGGRAVQGATHEIWSNNGEYMYFIAFDMGQTYNLGDVPAVVRFDKDGSHRKYYYSNDSVPHQNKHCSPSGDDRYVAADGDYLVVISTETWEAFPISRYEWNGEGSHPYHGHAVVARNHYVLNWGGKDKYGMLGVKWFDFTELVSAQAKGGHFEMGENVSRASYEGLECESSEITIKNRDAVYSRGGKSIFIDISEELIDTDNGKIKLSFDYLDNGVLPIDIVYTSGVKTDYDRYRIFDAKKSITRRGTNTWKHAEIIIDSGNFEDIGKFDSDIRISGRSAYVYLSNVKASVPEEK